MLDMIQDHATKAKHAIVQSALAENKAYEAMARYQDILVQDESVIDELAKKDNVAYQNRLNKRARIALRSPKRKSPKRKWPSPNKRKSKSLSHTKVSPPS